MDQIAEGSLLLDDARVVLDVGTARHAVGERRDVRGTADLLELAGPLQLVLQRHEVDGIAALAERDHLVEDAAMRIAEEVARVYELGRVVERVVVNQDGAENGLLGFQVVRKRAFGGGDLGHHRIW